METINLIQAYYNFFNSRDWEGMLSLLDENVQHDENQGTVHNGKEKFREFLLHMEECYSESLENLKIMTDITGKNAACKFWVNGKYLKTDRGLPEATGQTYRLEAGTFFEISNHRITRVTTYYNLNEWLRLIL